MRRPLFFILAVLSAAIWAAVLLMPWSVPDYEDFRGREIVFVGTVRSIEPKLDGDSIIYRMILTDIEYGDEQASARNTITKDCLFFLQNETAYTDKYDDYGRRIKTNTEESAFRGLEEADAEKYPEMEKGERVLCVLEEEPMLEISSRVRVRGTIYPFQRAMNEGEFDVLQYYHILRVSFQLRDADILASSGPADPLAAVLYRVRRKADQIIDRSFTAQNAPLVKAMLLGEKGLLDGETRELYQGAGIMHILSISGLHLSLIGMGLFSLLGKMRYPLLSREDTYEREHVYRISSSFPGIRWRPLPVPFRAALSLLTVFLYGKMTGMGTSAFRALVMLSLYIIAKLIGRTYDILTASLLACILLLFDQPLYLLHTGFQFSFAAVLSMGILAPALPGKKLPVLAVPLGTLPVYLWAYGTFPVYSLLLNLIVIPLMPAVMCSAGAAVLLGAAAGAVPWGTGAAGMAGDTPLFLRLLVRIAGFPAEVLLDMYRLLAEISQRLPAHELVLGRPSAGQLVVYYALLILFSACSAWLQMPNVRRGKWGAGGGSVSPAGRGKIKTAEIRAAVLQDKLYHLEKSLERRLGVFDNRERRYLAIGTSILWMVVCIGILTFRIPPSFEMDILYVGQGDGIVIRSNNETYLIDGGSSSKEELARYTLLPFLHCKGIGSLDGVLISHEDGDHCSGLLEMLEKAESGKPMITVRRIYLPDIAENARGEKYRRIETLAETLDIPVEYIHRGQRIRTGNLTFDCLHPAAGASYEDANQTSMTLLLQYRRKQERSTGELLEKGTQEEKKEELQIKTQENPQGNPQEESQEEPQGNPQEESQEESQKYEQQVPEENSFKVLLTGDLEKEGEEDFLTYLDSIQSNDSKDSNDPDVTKLSVDILKVAHHGSRFATTEDFLQRVTAGQAVISAGLRNRYGHPSPDTLERLEKAGMETWCTKDTGQIKVTEKGVTLKKGDN